MYEKELQVRRDLDGKLAMTRQANQYFAAMHTDKAIEIDPRMPELLLQICENFHILHDIFAEKRKTLDHMLSIDGICMCLDCELVNASAIQRIEHGKEIYFRKKHTNEMKMLES